MRASLPLDRYRPEWRAAVVGIGLAALLGGLAYLLMTHWQSSGSAIEATAAAQMPGRAPLPDNASQS